MPVNYFSNIQKIENAIRSDSGFDFVIVVSSDRKQAEFWQKRLNRFKGKIIGKNTKIISQYEDWKGGGAGKLLGTLHAFQKADKENRLIKALENGKRVAIYHTAGQGKRMAPLTFSEGGNKPAIKLPKVLAKGELFTILDAVIFQTQAFAKSRPGRLCVFWGDQIVIPSENLDFGGVCHGEIFGIRKEIPRRVNVWQREWQHYGILALDGSMTFLQREKLIWQEFKILRKSLDIKKLSKSLGFFSWSHQFLKALLAEFSFELKEKRGKLDTDFHLWTPLTSSREEFLSKGEDGDYWDRLHLFRERFLAKTSKDTFLIKDKDLGEDALWWDFGQLPLYYQNLAKLLADSPEGEAMRRFFGVKKTNNFISVNSKTGGKIKNSLIINSRAEDSSLEGAIIINSNVKKLIAKKVLLYNFKNSKEETLNVGEVACGVKLKNKKSIILKTNLDRDGKRDWENKILGNKYSYKDLEKLV